MTRICSALTMLRVWIRTSAWPAASALKTARWARSNLAKLCSNPEPETRKPFDQPWTEKHFNVDYRTNRTAVAESGTAPCKMECPAHIPVQGYIKLASQGKYLEALELIKKENPFPAVCGRICNRKCEDACTRGDIDQPIAIDDIKKFIADKELSAETRYVPKMLNQTGKPFTNKIAVIGGGPSGLSCAYYLAVKGYPVTVFEKGDRVGGMLTRGIPRVSGSERTDRGGGDRRPAGSSGVDVPAPAWRWAGT